MIVIDRIEDTMAVLEMDGIRVVVPLSVLPAGVREGSRLAFVPEETPADSIAEDEARLARLQARDPGDEIIDL